MTFRTKLALTALLSLGFCTVTCLISTSAATANESVSSLPTLSPGKPEEVGVDPEKLQQAARVVKQAVDRDELRGAVILVARKGKIILHEAYGFRDLKGTVPMERDSLFRMASNSKAITAAAVLCLVDDGVLALDDPVAKYLPDFAVPKSSQITIRQLLTHTAGFRIKTLFVGEITPKSEEHPEGPNIVLEMGKIAQIGPEVPPGTSYSYSNAGYNVLAGLVESQTGSFKEFVRKRIYEPLGMSDSCNHESDADRARMSTVFRRAADGSWQVRWEPTSDPDLPIVRGSGGMISTARDYAVFYQTLLNKGVYAGKRILSEALVQEATTPQIGHIAAATNYGLGLQTPESGQFAHSGSDGTWVWADVNRQLLGMVLTQSQQSTNPRQAFRELVNASIVDGDVPSTTISQQTSQTEGFYKDIFMDGGVHLTSRKVLHAAHSLGLADEYFAGNDVARQNELIVGNDADLNGVLLYPDGEPRFRMIYVNGGGATSHGKSLTPAGRLRLRAFNGHGGSYCGSCAGSFLCGLGVDQQDAPREGYLHLFPFNTLNTGLKKTRLGHFIPENSPLLRYRDFGDDRQIDDIYHNNGNWLSTSDGAHLADTEILATYNHPGHKTHEGAAVWAFQKDGRYGRVVSIGSHPEGVEEGERLALTEACFLYAMEGNGKPKIKGQLADGFAWEMTKQTGDNLPVLTRIGDRQYHHFQMTVDEKTPKIRIQLQGDQPADLHLFLNRDKFAFRNSAQHELTTDGPNKTFEAVLEPGTWYVSVKCASSVMAINDAASGFYRYFDNLQLLNGTAYRIEMNQSEN